MGFETRCHRKSRGRRESRDAPPLMVVLFRSVVPGLAQLYATSAARACSCGLLGCCTRILIFGSCARQLAMFSTASYSAMQAYEKFPLSSQPEAFLPASVSSTDKTVLAGLTQSTLRDRRSAVEIGPFLVGTANDMVTHTVQMGFKIEGPATNISLRSAYSKALWKNLHQPKQQRAYIETPSKGSRRVGCLSWRRVR